MQPGCLKVIEMTDDNEGQKKEFDDFDSDSKIDTSLSMSMLPTVGAIKGALAEYTIFPVIATPEEREEARTSPIALTAIMTVLGFIELILLFILMKIDENVFQDNLSMLLGVIVAVFPLFLFRFNFVGDLVRYGNKLFPDNAEAGAGIVFAMIFIMTTFVFYTMIAGFGTWALLLCVPLLNICATHALVTAKKFTGEGDSFIMSLVVTVIAAILFSVIALAMTDALELKYLIATVVAVLIASLMGVLVPYIAKIRFGIEACVSGATIEMARPVIMGITFIVVMMI